MEAEQLQVKVTLDASGVTAGVNKVKTQLTGMANKVKQSIPQISKESKKAGNALSGLSTVSNKVKKSLDGIGDEARDSLGEVVTLSQRAKAALGSIGSGTSGIKFGINTDGMAEGAGEASGALNEMQSAMQAIVGLNFADLIIGNFDKIKKTIKDVTSGIKKSFEGLKESISWFKSDMDLGVSWKNTFKDMKSDLKNISDGFLAAAKSAGIFAIKVAAVGAAALAATGIAIANASKEYNEGQAKLLSAYQAVGAGAKEATQAYRGLFRFLGDPATSVEAANHLAKITTNTKDLAEWTKIAQGVYATFGDSLRIESLTEAANETIRVGKVTSSMADALNWAGISEDAFNAQLAETTSIEERELLVRKTLNGLYGDAAEIYERNNRAIIAQNEAKARLQATMGRIAKTVQPLITSFINLANVLLTVLRPAISWVSAVFSVLVDKLAAALKWLGALVGIEFESTISDGLSSATGSISNAVGGISDAAGAAGDLKDNLSGATKAAEKLKRTTMGFDELNIVGNPNSSASSGGASGGAGGGIGGGAGAGSIIPSGSVSVIDKIAEKTENLKKKIEDFFDKWKVQIGIIAAALAALGVFKLIESLGKAIGLGDKFLGIMKTLKGAAATVITVTLQYTMVNEFLDNFIDGEGFKEYLKAALVTAIGTGILYAIWGTAGLAIGLGVTAVASIKSVIDNGGITNLESATVALTGVATAIGAIIAAVAAWKKIGFLEVVKLSLSGAKNLLLKVPVFLSGLWTDIVIGLKLYWAQITGFLSKSWSVLWAGITKALTALKTALVTVVKFIIANPIALVIAAIVALVALIAVKGDEIQKALNKVSDWIKGVFVRDWREVFGNTLGTIMNGFVKIAGDIIGNMKRILNGIIDFIRGVFTGDWRRAWNGIKDIFAGAFNGLKALAKAPLNAVITLINGALSAITSGLNAVKRQLNKISINIPSWVPKYGGSKFGFNFSMSSAPKIPMLAKGGIAVSSTLANIGERGKEAILPLESNTGWMDTLADRIAARNNAPSKIVLMVDGKELGWAAINNVNAITKQTGNLQLILG